MSTQSLFRAALAGVALSLAAVTSQAAPLYGADDQLYSINAATGASVAIGAPNGAYRLGLSYNALNDKMYSLGPFDGTLSTVDLGTGATTLVGSSAFSLTGLTFDTAYVNLYSLDGNGGPLVRVSPADGSAVLVGGGGNNMLDLSMRSDGVLFGGGFGGIGTFDVMTGTFTPIGGNESWTAIAFDEFDQLYGIEIGGDALYKIDAVTGAATLVGGNIGGDVRGMDFVFGAANGVPLPGGLALLSLALAGLALTRRGR